MTAEKGVFARWAERTASRAVVKGHEATQVTGLTTLIGQGASGAVGPEGAPIGGLVRGRTVSASAILFLLMHFPAKPPRAVSAPGGRTLCGDRRAPCRAKG